MPAIVVLAYTWAILHASCLLGPCPPSLRIYELARGSRPIATKRSKRSRMALREIEIDIRRHGARIGVPSAMTEPPIHDDPNPGLRAKVP